MKYRKKIIGIIILLLTATAQRAAAQEYFTPPQNVLTALQTVQLHTNTLYWLAMTPNIGIELQTDNGIAWQLDYMGAWWNSHKSNHYYSNYGFQTEVRYYLDDAAMDAPFTGHHLGLYGQMMTYDFEFGGTGYQCANLTKTWGIGMAYGYVWPLTRRLSLDVTIGIGYLSSRYTKYVPTDSWYRVVSNDNKWTWFGPTRLEATLVYNINMFNDK